MDTNRTQGGRRTWLLTLGMALAGLTVSSLTYAQDQGQGGGVGLAARESAPIDLTGYWTAVITEDWAQRMLTPARGDFGGGPPGAVRTPGRAPIGTGADPTDEGNIPYEAAGAQAALAWNPADADTCMAYGAPGIMRQPTRFRIAWKDDDTLQLETDLGVQTRLFHFADPPRPGRMNYIGGRFVPPRATAPTGPPNGLEPSPQGHSIASWTSMGGSNAVVERGGYLKVETTNLTPGYYWRNGMPYTGDAVLTEHFRVMELPDGSSWILLSLMVEDPEYLNQPFLVHYHFKKLPDGSTWDPVPCL